MPAWPKRPPKPQRGQVAPLFIVGVDSIKRTLLARLRIEEPGAGYCHFPEGRDLDYFRGLMSEKPIRIYKGGVAKIKWVVDSGVRNEPLDCRVYAVAALQGNAAAGIHLSELAKILNNRPKTTSTKEGAKLNSHKCTIKSNWLKDR